MDAVFVVDEDYDTFERAWKDFEKIVSIVNPKNVPMAESLRFTLKGPQGKKWAKISPFEPDQIGWHFSAAPQQAFLKNLAQQGKTLQEQKIPYRITCDPMGRADALEVRGTPFDPIKFIIPFEDRVENASRFFGRFAKGLAQACEVSESRMLRLFESFYEHCQSYLKEERPFSAKVRGRLPMFGKKALELSWVPRHGFVGRHEILTHLEITHPFNDLVLLATMLVETGQVGRISKPHLSFQFFSPWNTQPPIHMPEENLLEMTFQYGQLSFSKTKKLVEEFYKTQGVGAAITDTFSVFDQKAPKIGEDCNATYTLRKTPNRGYEIRVNTIWESDNVDPEKSVIPLEKACGLTWSRIV